MRRSPFASSTPTRRWISASTAVVVAVALVQAISSPARAAGPSVPLPGTASVNVSPQSMGARGPDEATSRSLHGDQPAGGSTPDGGGVPSATSLAPSATWDVSAQTGDFSWSYPLRVPPAPGGLEPTLALSYSSSAVDGRTSATNNQASWVGDGWDLSPGFIERVYGACAEDSMGGTTPPKTGDLCWRSDNAIASYNGGGGMLIRDDATGAWKPKRDDGSRIERLTGAGNGDDNGEHWRITTPDGTQYLFGSRPEAGSTWTVPVFGDDANEPCHQSTFATSSCTQAYRWNLDQVIDRHGNLMRYTYDTETNSYARNLVDTAVSYIRGGSLRRIEYGLNNRVDAPASGRVEFLVADRCVPGSTCTFDRPENWPDVPLSERCDKPTCKNHYSPTFWSTKRLERIVTQVRRGTGYSDVDSWALEHQFPDPGDGEKAALWLRSITHSGLIGGSATLPPVTFEGAKMPNRVVRVDGIGPLIRYRITGIVAEAGGITSINYAPVDCTEGSLPANPETNNRRCFPVRWTKRNMTERTDYFHKYVVASVTTSDRIAANVSQQVAYSYLDGAAWHYDTSEFTPPAKKTWNTFRGFGRVHVRSGSPDDPAGPITMAEKRFYRGMNGDHLPSGTRTATVSDSVGGVRTDHDWLAGLEFESSTHLGESEQVVSRSVIDPVWVGPLATRDTFQSYRINAGVEREFLGLESGGWRETRTETGFDDRGRPTTVNDLGDVATEADDRCGTTTYAANTDKWLINFPVRTELVSVRCGQAPRFPEQALSDSRVAYDGRAYGEPPLFGNVTASQELDQRPASGPVYLDKSTASHDVHGRVTALTDAAGHTTRTAFTPATGGPVTKVTVTNPKGHATNTDLEPASGQPTLITDVNGRKTETAYDPLGRVIEGWLANRPRVNGQFGTGNVRYAYHVQRDAPTYLATTTIGPNGTYTATHTFYDGLFRVRQVQAPAAGGGRLIVDTRYDSQGRPYKTTQPYFNDAPVDATLWVAADVDVPGLTFVEYDGAGRPVTSIFKGGGAEKWRTTKAYGGDRVHVSPPPGGVATTTIGDARGLTTHLRTYHSGQPSGTYDETRYTYTPARKLASVTDPAGTTWRYRYDLRGRKVADEDPDRGTTTTVYDRMSRPSTTTDARGRTLAYSYDELGRRTGVYIGQTTGTKLATWTYDTAAFGKGKPASATRWVNGTEPYTKRVNAYTALYQPGLQSVTIPASEVGLAGTYQVSSKFNPDGSTMGTSVPAAGGLPEESLAFTYDDFGRPLTTTGGLAGGTVTYANATSYTRYGEVSRIELGEGTHRVWLSYHYDDHTRRPKRSIVDAELPRPMQADINYTYDQAGNVTSIADTPQNQPADVQCFRYDHLRRLTEAWTPGSADACGSAPSTAALSGPAPYWQSFQLDKVGNRLSETHHTGGGDTIRAYAYPAADAAHPHAVNSVTTTGPSGQIVDRYGYDEAGNTVSRTVGSGGSVGETLTWDAQGHLAEVTRGTQKTSFLYDADGQRLIRRDPTSTTLYLGGQEVRRSHATGAVTATRYYSHTAKTVAMRTNAGLTWLATDHQGTQQIAINAGDLTVVRRRQTPFGAERGPQVTFPGERGFVGGTKDPSTGLVHLGAREYDPAIGRFISVDPIMDLGDPQQMQGYSYANNSPITFSDPTGLKYCSDDACTQWVGPDGKVHGKGANNPPPAPGAPAAAPPKPSKTIMGVGEAGINEAYGQAHDEGAKAKRRGMRTHYTIIHIYVEVPSGIQAPGGVDTVLVPGILIALTFTIMPNCAKPSGPTYEADPMTRAEREAYDAAHPPEAPTPRRMTAGEFLASITGVDTVVDCLLNPSWAGCGFAIAGMVPVPPVKGASIAAKTVGDIPPVIYRGGTQTDNALTDKGTGLSFRDSKSNPIGGPPVLRPGEKYFGVDTSKLPKGSVVWDNDPPGHVSVFGVDPADIRSAIIDDPDHTGRFPKK